MSDLMMEDEIPDRDTPPLPEYDRAVYRQFVKEMRRSGFTVTHYHGRFFYEGPAASGDDLQELLRGTKVKCQWDNLGLGWIVYPQN